MDPEDASLSAATSRSDASRPVTSTDAVRAAVVALSGAERAVVLTGAGISTESGIPDFRGPQGVWTKDPDAEKYSTIGHYLSDPELRQRAWRFRRSNPAFGATPNRGHDALVRWDRARPLELLVTQNTDGLHLRAGSDPDRLVEVHGNMRRAQCTACDWQGPMEEVVARIDAGEPDPPCPRCGGILKAAVIFFGEQLVAEDLQRSFDAAARCDALICVGTSLQVYPVAHMVPMALAAGAALVVVNGEPTDFDGEAVVVRGAIGEVLPAIVDGLLDAAS